MGFQHLSRDERKAAAVLGGLSRRSPATRRAWSNADHLKEEYRRGVKTPVQIATENHINLRTFYRIVRGR